MGVTSLVLGILSLVMYSVMRIILEFFRFDGKERGLLLGISTSQYIGFAIIVAVLLTSYLEKKSSLPKK